MCVQCFLKYNIHSPCTFVCQCNLKSDLGIHTNDYKMNEEILIVHILLSIWLLMHLQTLYMIMLLCIYTNRLKLVLSSLLLLLYYLGIDEGLLGSVKDSVVQSFQWGMKEGLLYEDLIIVICTSNFTFMKHISVLGIIFSPSLRMLPMIFSTLSNHNTTNLCTLHVGRYYILVCVATECNSLLLCTNYKW